MLGPSCRIRLGSPAVVWW